MLITIRSDGRPQSSDVAYVIDGDHAQLRPVRLGVLGMSAVEVSEGLQPGDRVVVSGSERFEGAPRVRVRF